MISVVIVTKDERPVELQRCITALMNQTFTDFEVVVVLPRKVKNPEVSLVIQNEQNVRVVRQSGKGICNARNCGVKASQGEIIAFTDDDAEPHRNWLQKISQHFKELPELDYLGGEFTLIPKNIWQRWVDKRYHLRETDIERGWCHGNNMAYRRAVFNSNLFDENIHFGADEADFQNRLQRLGMHSATFKDILIRHQHRDSFLSFTKMRWKYAQGYSYLLETKQKQPLFHWDDLLNLSFFLSCAYALIFTFMLPWFWIFPLLFLVFIILHGKREDGSLGIWAIDVYVSLLWTLSKMWYSLVGFHFRRWGWIK